MNEKTRSALKIKGADDLMMVTGEDVPLPGSSQMLHNLEEENDGVGMDIGAFDNYDDEHPGFTSVNTDTQSMQAKVKSISSVPFEGVELVAEPQRVQNIHINYATKAKRVDVKSLKKSLWLQMKHKSDHKRRKSKSSEEISFHEILQDLPDKLPESERASVSVPLAFICLLHLANEKNLVLTQSNLNELNISNLPN